MFRTTFACLIFSALAFSQAKAPVAVVSSRAAITIEGVNAPVTGGVAWPVAAGDVIQTSSAPAEIRLTDGTKIFLPAGSKFIVPAPAPQADVAVHRAVDARSSAYTSVPTAAIPRIAPAGNKLSHGILNILDGGIVEPPSVLSPLALAQSRPLASGSTPATVSLTGLLAVYGVNSPVVQAISQALGTVGATLNVGPNGTFYITGVEVTIGNNPPQPATIVISGTSINIYPGIVSPGSTNPPPPLLTVTPPGPGSSVPSGCKGATLAPADVTNSIINITIPGSC